MTLDRASLPPSEAAAETLIDSRGVDLIRKKVISAALRGPVGLPSSGALSVHPSTKRYELSRNVGEMAGITRAVSPARVLATRSGFVGWSPGEPPPMRGDPHRTS